MFGVWPAFSINWKCWQTWKYFRVYREILATLKIFRNHCPSFVVGYKNQKKKKKKTHPKPLSPHPQPRLRTNPTTEFEQTMIESDYQRRVPQLPPFLDYFSISLIKPMLQRLPPFLDYFSISLIEPMLQRWDPAMHATIELLMTPPSHQLICFSLYISHVIVNLVFSFFFFCMFSIFIVDLLVMDFFFRILWVNGEFFFFPKWVKH